jgi:hypothetical protein
MLQLSEALVVNLIKQMPPDQKREALFALAEGATERREERMRFAESQLRRVAGERGLDWDKMSDEDREALVDDLMHEDRRCQE